MSKMLYKGVGWIKGVIGKRGERFFARTACLKKII